jgi:hypothetical protein
LCSVWTPSLPGSGSGSLPAIICTVLDPNPSIYKPKFMKYLFLLYRDLTGVVIICTVPDPDPSVYFVRFRILQSTIYAKLVSTVS